MSLLRCGSPFSLCFAVPACWVATQAVVLTAIVGIAAQKLPREALPLQPVQGAFGLLQSPIGRLGHTCLLVRAQSGPPAREELPPSRHDGSPRICAARCLSQPGGVSCFKIGRAHV